MSQLSTSKRRRVAIALAFAGSLPMPLPLTWLHKFYLGEYLWGVVYLILAPTMLPKVACCLEGLWYLSLRDEIFNARFPKAGALLAGEAADAKNTAQAKTAEVTQQVAMAVRDLDKLRQEGLITDYEFEQKRRTLLSEIS